MRNTNSAAKLLLGASIAFALPTITAGSAWAQPTTTVTSTSLPAPIPPAPAPEDTCVGGVWPSNVEGRPLQFEAGDHGLYLWHDPDGGWALRATHAGPHDKVVFSGTLTTGGQFADVKRVKDEANDIVVLSPNKHTILFRFVNFGYVDGLDFATHCSKGFTASFDISGHLAPSGKVHLGAGEVNPTSNPFRVERT
jgi:hypothetical protein